MYERNSGLKFFSPFLDLSHPVLVKKNAGKRFFVIFEFFCYFFRNFLARVKFERNLGLNFFSFSSFLIPFWLGIMRETGFLIFSNFFAIFFWIFMFGVQCKRNSGLKVFSPFHGLSLPILGRNISWNRFFNFFNFFANFFRIFFPGSSMNGIGA